MQSVRVYFATNRNHQPENTKLVFGPRFNADGVAALRYGHVDFAAGVETAEFSSHISNFLELARSIP